MMNSPRDARLSPKVRPEPAWFRTDDGLSLAYDDFGSPEGDPIVFLHGGTDSRVTWDHVAPVVEGSYRTMMPDARGQGDSDLDPRGYDVVEPFVADVAALCEEMLDRPAVLVGASHGGVIAAEVAARRPDLVRGLFLLDPPLFGEIPDAIVALFDALGGVLAAVAGRSGHDRQAAVQELLAGAPAATGEGTMTDALGSDGVERLAFSWSRVDPSFVSIVREVVADDEPFGFNGHIDCSTLVVRADPDSWACCFAEPHEARLRAICPDVEFIVASGVGHMIHNEQPAWVADKLAEFLARL